MGLFGFGGGLKVSCSQCDKKIKGTAVTRRSLPFCSHECEAAFVAQHPIAPARGGTPDENRAEAVNRLIAGVGELYAASRESSSRYASSLQVGSRTFTIQFGAQRSYGPPSEADIDAARSSLSRYEQLALEALPYLYASGRTAQAEHLERVDIGTLRDGLPGTHGSIVNVAHDIHQVLVALAD